MTTPITTLVKCENLVPLILDAWERTGNPVGLDKHLQIRALLKQLPANMPVEQLKTLLAPLLATDSQEQQEFYQLFDAQVELLKAADAKHQLFVEREIHSARRQAMVRYVSDHRHWFLTAASAVALVMFGLFYHFSKAPEYAHTIVSLLEPPGKIISIDVGENIVAASRISAFTQFSQIEQEAFEGGYLYLKIDPLKVGTDTIVYELRHSPDDIRLFRVILTVDMFIPDTKYVIHIPPRTKPIKADPRIISESKTNDNKPANNPVVSDMDTANLLQDSAGQAAKLGKYVEGVSTRWQFGFGKAYLTVWKGLLFLFALLAAWLAGAWINHNRRRLTMRHAQKLNPPDEWHLSVPRVENIGLSERFHLLLKDLRKRNASDIERLDFKKTIRKTVENGGMIQFQYSPDNRSKEYLALVDLNAPQNHRAKLYDEILTTLQEWEAPVERFYFNSNIQFCWNEKHEHGVTLRHLQHKYYNHHLIIFGTNETLLHPESREFLPWTELFDDWKRKALLTPKPAREWGEKEAILSQRFRILPATPKGFSELVETLEAVEPKDYLTWKTNTEKEYDPLELPHELSADTLLPFLEKHFIIEKNGKNDDRLVRWIMACALPPALFWEWTLYVGDMLSERNEQYVTADKLFMLNRLAWFVQGNISDGARRILLKSAEERYPIWFDRVKQEWAQLLEFKENIPPIGSMAWENHRIQLLLTKLLNNPKRGARRKLEAELETLLSTREKPDALAMHYIEKRESQLQSKLSPRLRKYFYQKQGIFWRLRHWVWQVPLVLSSLLSLLLVHYTEPVTTFEFKNHITALSFSPNAQSIATASGMGDIGICQASGAWEMGLESGMDKVLSVQFSSDQSQVAAGSASGDIAVWDASGKQVVLFKIPGNRLLTAIVFSPELDTAIIGFYSGQVQIWDVRKQELIREIKAHTDKINDLAFSYDGKHFLTGSSDKTAKLWTMEGDLIQDFAGQKGEILAMDISPDGKMAITGGSDEMLHIWDRSGKIIRSIAAHKDILFDAHFSPDGQQILTSSGGSTENAAKLWTLEGKLIRTFIGHTNYVRTCAFAPDNSAVATGDAHGVVKIWQLKKAEN